MKLKNERARISAPLQEKYSLQIIEHIKNLAIYQQASNLALYRAVGREVNLDGLWQAAELAEKKCYFPKMTPQGLIFLPALSSTFFTKNPVGILEPNNNESQARTHFDLFILPLVGFNRKGDRLGMGTGCYDTFLSSHPQTHCVGVGYAFQECPDLVCEAIDYPLDIVVTELAVLNTNKRG